MAIPAPMTGTVNKVIDGGTIQVDVNGIWERVRLIGIDTSELKDPRKPVEHFAQEASDYTNRELSGKSVRLEFDQANNHVGHRDRYGRLLAYVLVGDVSFNQTIIRNGYAHAYKKYPFARMEQFRQAEKEARKNGAGLWAAPGEPTEQERENVKKVVYIILTGEKYHRAGCRFLDQSKVELNLARALDIGYEPCGRCKP